MGSDKNNVPLYKMYSIIIILQTVYTDTIVHTVHNVQYMILDEIEANLLVFSDLFGHLPPCLSTGNESIYSLHMLWIVVSVHEETRTEVAELP